MTHDKSRREQIAEDHRQLHALLQRVEQAPDGGALAALMGQLGPRLAEHFELEESVGGLHDAIGDAAPHQLAAVGRLFEEHREILALVQRVAQEIEGADSQSIEGVRATTSELLARLRSHEARETELLSESMSTDIGGAHD